MRPWLTWPPRWLIRRRQSQLQAWLKTEHELSAKLARISADMASHSARRTLTIKEATARLTKALQTPSDPIR